MDIQRIAGLGNMPLLLVDAVVAVDQVTKECVYQKKMELPPRPVAVQGLIDTGASISVISKSLVSRLRLVSRGDCKVTGFDRTGDTPERFLNYPVSIQLLDESGEVLLEKSEMQVISSSLPERGYELLIGCDLLEAFQLEINFPVGTFSLRPAR